MDDVPLFRFRPAREIRTDVLNMSTEDQSSLPERFIFYEHGPEGEPAKLTKFKFNVDKAGWRFMAWHEEQKAMELVGWFTAEDLRKIAEWMKDPSHPTKPYPIIDLKLSKP